MSHIKFDPIPDDSDRVRLMQDRMFVFQKFVRSKPDGYVMNANYVEYAPKTDNLEIRDDDIFIITYPRSGTTWCQEMLWCIAHNVDLEGAKETLLKRSPFWEYDALLPPGGVEVIPPEIMAMLFGNQSSDDPATFGKHIEFLQKCPSPRVIKTHLPLSLLPPKVKEKARIVYCARHPKDNVVSFYQLFKSVSSFVGTFEEFADLYVNDLMMWGPQGQHVLEHWKLRDTLPNLLFLTFEEMKSDIEGVINRVSKHLEVGLTKDQIAQLKDHLSFESMQNNPAVSFEESFSTFTSNFVHSLQNKQVQFYTKGKVGGWRSAFNPELNDAFNQYIEKYYKDTDLPYEPDDL
ncbi:unnamed protein product [Cyprideis torosa]|uniref:Uncharacterized protein n=1 Tax=Cyprideis torosa TaxID=163714 RepID=A0A7R8W3S9_9CRUS|nr:unnamed protein product [Cyprideis torosa]CAG0882449.1 unnamed protein product [Cyprideis torosa]